jgi:heme/copper-type cytochrome/quinol oxidase subunit 2
MMTFRMMAGAAVLLLAMTIGSAGADATARIVELTATRDNQFKLGGGSKGPLVLKAGETVKFRIVSYFGGEKARDGSVHSFVVRNLRDTGWDVRLKEGLNEFTLVAPGAGDYLVECTVKCGPGHDSMNLKMQVR